MTGLIKELHQIRLLREALADLMDYAQDKASEADERPPCIEIGRQVLIRTEEGQND